MSGGSSPPSAPSYAGIGQSAQTFGTATANSQQATNAAQAYNQNANANLTSALGTANQNASTLSNSANQNLSQYASTFSPLQAQEAQAASQYGSNQNIQKLTGQAVANVNAGQQAAQQNNAAALAAEGVDPASIHGGAIQAAGNVQNAANAANAGTQAGIQAQQTAFGMQNTGQPAWHPGGRAWLTAGSLRRSDRACRAVSCEPDRRHRRQQPGQRQQHARTG